MNPYKAFHIIVQLIFPKGINTPLLFIIYPIPVQEKCGWTEKILCIFAYRGLIRNKALY